MLVNAKEMLIRAKDSTYAIPQFNINNLEWTKFILEECNKLNSPVILGVSEGAAKYMGGFKTVYNLVEGLIYDLNIKIPVALHLDHGRNAESCKKAIDNGFTSVMIDGSSHPLEENVAITKEVVLYAHDRDVTVEAEVGHIGGSEDGIEANIAYANLEDCVELVLKTGVDFLAPALGSVHGIYKGEPKIDTIKMKEIRDATNIPLVLHGGTGIGDEIIINSISSGICKININTELQMAWNKYVRNYIDSNKDIYDPRKIISAGEQAIKKVVRDKVMLFGSSHKA